MHSMGSDKYIWQVSRTEEFHCPPNPLSSSLPPATTDIFTASVVLPCGVVGIIQLCSLFSLASFT